MPDPFKGGYVTDAYTFGKTPITAPWIRILLVKFTSRKTQKVITFGETEDENGNSVDPLTIRITGHKYMSALSDSFTIEIENLTWAEIIELVRKEYLDVEIIAGYKNTGVRTIFKGGVLYFSNDLGDRKTTKLIAICGSEIASRFSSSYINLSLKSGINMYSAIKFICDRGGVPNSNISKSLKNRQLQSIFAQNSGVATWSDYFAKSQKSLIVNTDGSSGSQINVFDIALDGPRYTFPISADNMTLIGDYPKLTSAGVSFDTLPTIGIRPGDAVRLDNSLINLARSSIDSGDYALGYYLDEDMTYLVFELNYNLCNRDGEFSIGVQAMSRNLYDSVREVSR